MEKTALITGASCGIGLELAKLFAKDGFDLVLVARDRKTLKDVKSELERENGVKVMAIVLDLLKGGACEKLLSELEKKDIVLDVLVNNAGVGDYGEFKDCDIERELDLIKLNNSVMTELTRRVLPSMIKRKSGRVMNLGSIASFIPGPMMAVYFATKAYVLSFSEALSEELKNSQVTVTCFCPGPTKTQFQKRAGQPEDTAALKHMAIARAAAEYGYDALWKGKVVAVHGIRNKFNVFLTRVLPRGLVRRMVHNRMR